MNKTITYEDFLEQYGEMTYRVKGISMRPFLRQETDLFTVRKKSTERCRKYDVVLYRRPPKQYVLHRIVKVRDNDYVILGDNCVNKEYGIKDEDIIGVVTEFSRNGRRIMVGSIPYRIYSVLWYHLYPMRMCYRRFLHKLKMRKD